MSLPPYSRFSWDDANVAKLKVLYFDGKSCGDIARVLGCGRSAVIGKVHRLGLPLRGQSSGRQMADAARKGIKSRKAPDTFRAASGKPVPARPDGMGWVRLDQRGSVKLAVPPDDGIPETAVSLVDLEPHHCRWVHGDSRGKHAYCGKPKVLGLSYCEGHAARAYRAPPTQPERDAAVNKFREKAKEMA